MSANKTVASILILRVRMSRLNIISQSVQVFGFMRLGRMPAKRKGAESTPRNGIGTRSCCQQPLQMTAGASDMSRPSSPALPRRDEDYTPGTRAASQSTGALGEQGGEKEAER